MQSKINVIRNEEVGILCREYDTHVEDKFILFPDELIAYKDNVNSDVFYEHSHLFDYIKKHNNKIIPELDLQEIFFPIPLIFIESAEDIYEYMFMEYLFYQINQKYNEYSMFGYSSYTADTFVKNIKNSKLDMMSNLIYAYKLLEDPTVIINIRNSTDFEFELYDKIIPTSIYDGTSVRYQGINIENFGVESKDVDEAYYNNKCIKIDVNIAYYKEDIIKEDSENGI